MSDYTDLEIVLTCCDSRQVKQFIKLHNH